MAKGSPQPFLDSFLFYFTFIFYFLYIFIFGDNLQYIYQIKTDEQPPLQAESMTPERLSLLQHINDLYCGESGRLVRVFKQQFSVFLEICVIKKVCRNTYNII